MIRLHLLGGVRLEGDDAASRRSVLTQPRRLALLAYLAVRARHGAQRRDELLGVFWPESDARRARGALRNALHFLRLGLGAGVLDSRGSEEVTLESDALWCDVVEFEDLCDQGELDAALQLYTGDLLSGFFISDAPAFEHWLDGERERLRQRAAAAARTLAETADSAGNAGLAAQHYRRVLELAPTDESALRGLMRALAAADDRGQALRVYDAMQARLCEEYGIELAGETTSLAESIRRAPPPPEAMVAAAVAGPVRPTASPAPPVRWRRRVVGALAATVALIPLGIGMLARTATDPAPSPGLVAVMPFEYRGPPEHAWLAEGLADLLAANLDGTGDLRVVDPRALLPRLQAGGAPLDRAAARRAASTHGAGLFVVGSITATADRLRITASLGGASSHDAAVEGHADHLLDLADQLTLALLEGRTELTRLTRSAARTTHAVAALKAYLEGEAAARRLDTSGAIDAFRRATEIDSTFALAYYRLSTAAHWQGVSAVPVPAAAAALRHAGRLIREDSLLVAAWYHHVRGSPAEAHSLYQQALVLRPGHVEAAFQFGELLFHWGSVIGVPASEAREPFSRVLAAEPNNLQAALHLARLAARDGLPTELDSLVSVMRRIDPDGGWQVEIDALLAFTAGHAPAQVRAMEVAGRLPNRDRTILEYMAAFSGDMAAVERSAAERVALDRSPAEQARMQLFLVHVQLARGRYRAAEQTVRSSNVLPPARRLEYRAMMATLPFAPHSASMLAGLRAELAAHPHLDLRADGGPFADRGIEYPQLLWPGVWQPRRYYLLGALHMRLADTDGALAFADSLRGIASGERMAERYERLTRARVQATTAAVALRTLGLPAPWPLNTFESLVEHGRPYERWLRAELLRQSGRGAEALRWYGTFPDPIARDLPYVAPSHLRRAQIFEQAGDLEAAASHYRRFVTLWADADPELQPAVLLARERLLELEAGG